MKEIKISLLILFAIGIAIQFVQPARNSNGQILLTDISKLYAVPSNVQGILKTACYDCHSNNTSYPWYSHIQPGAWLMASHITEGKAMLNFSQFGEMSIRKQQSKLTGIANQVKDGEMPISSYTLIHTNAKLSESQKQVVINWATALKDSLSSSQ